MSLRQFTDPIHLLTRLQLPFLQRSRVPHDLTAVTSTGEEAKPRDARVTRASVDRVWQSVESLYRTGVYPAVQICVRRRGHVVLNRALGHASGNSPGEPRDAMRVQVTPETPFTLYSASKAVTAMVIHKLDEKRLLHLEDRVVDYIPEFGRHGKDSITIRHLLTHRAGIPNVPPEAMNLDLLTRPDRILAVMADQKPSSRPGLLLAYHAISGGFVLGEIVRRATGKDIRRVLEEEISRPLGFRWMRYGVKPRDVERVAVNAATGPPVPPPIAQLLRRALGAGMRDVVELSNDPRFLTGVIPSANVVATATELAAFYQCLLDEGEFENVRIFEPRTVRHAVAEQSYREFDLTLGVPLRHGLGLMLGDRPIGLFGPDTPQAFGHLGFTNIFAWADPERDLSVALLTSGKPVVSLHAVRLVQFLFEINRAFPKLRRRRPLG